MVDGHRPGLVAAAAGLGLVLVAVTVAAAVHAVAVDLHAAVLDGGDAVVGVDARLF